MSEHPEQIGPYRILGVLGRGGMGVVYRAEHRETGEAAALKTLRARAEVVLAGLRREIRALARLSHPGIVRILGEGMHDGLPWYAMEYVEGRTLRSFTNRQGGAIAETIIMPAGTGVVDPGAAVAAALGAPARGVVAPEVVATAVGLVRRVCAPLAFLHGEGVVHRDLKPDNILVRPAGTPVLVDFGIASYFAATGREALDGAHVAWGSVHYMAPEQVLGELVDARADVYALGCILFELLTGRPPFVGASFAAIAEGHVAQPPPAPSEVAAGVPAALDDLVMRLLAKSPRERIGYAEDVARALEPWDARPDAPEGPRPRSYLYRPEFSGRSGERGMLAERLAHLATRGGVALVAGESGIGKTRLLLETARSAVLDGARVLAGECPERPRARPLEPLRRPLEVVADICRERGPETTDRLLGERLRLLAPFSAALRSLGPSPRTDDVAGEAARVRVYGALTATLRALSELVPVLLVLDDLQWADELTLGWLEGVAADDAFARHAVLVLGAYRADEVPPALEATASRPGVARIGLARLDARALAGAAAGMLALAELPAPLADWLSSAAEGNPFFVAEYLRAAVDEGLLRRAPGGAWELAAGAAGLDAVGLPSTLVGVVSRRVAGLPAAASAFARVAAVAGRQVPAEVAAAASGLAERDVADAVAELRRRHVLEETSRGLVRFSHDRVREAVYATIGADALPRIHGAVAAATEASLPEAEWPLGALGRHWSVAGRPELAYARYVAGARRALAQYAYHEAERRYRAALALDLPQSSERARARVALGYDVLRAAGRAREAEGELVEALEEARRLPDARVVAEALHGLGAVREELGELTRARDAFEESLGLARACGDRALEGKVLSALGLVATEEGRLSDAQARCGEALGIARALGDRSLEARVLNNLVAILSDQGRNDDAVALAEESVRLHRETGDRRFEGISINNLAVLLYRIGRHDEASDAYRHALALHREVGNRRFEAIALVNLAVIDAAARRWDAAAARYEAVLGVLREVGDRRTEGVVLTNLGNVRGEQGRAADARALLERALAIHREVGNRRLVAITLGFAAAIERRAGDYDRAEALLAEALEGLEGVGDPVYDDVFACERAHLRLARGESARDDYAHVRESAARRATDSALEEALARLAAAVDAFEKGRPLAHGEAREPS